MKIRDPKTGIAIEFAQSSYASRANTVVRLWHNANFIREIELTPKQLTRIEQWVTERLDVTGRWRERGKNKLEQTNSPDTGN